MRRDNDTVKVSKITLYDVDYALYYHLSENIKPRIDENGSSIPVPVMFTNGEKWSQIRQYGFLRDNNKKVLAPIIAIRRTGVSQDDRLPIVDTNLFTPKFKVIPYKTMGMKYDRKAGQYLTNDSQEFYVTDVPIYVRIAYELILWTDLQEQMNNLVQPILGVSDHVWGDYYKFRVNVQDITHDNVNVPGEDRLVKSTMTLQVDGYLRNEYDYQQSTIQKAYSIKKVRFLEESTEQIFQDQLDDLSLPNPDDNVANRSGVNESLRRNMRSL